MGRERPSPQGPGSGKGAPSSDSLSFPARFSLLLPLRDPCLPQTHFLYPLQFSAFPALQISALNSLTLHLPLVMPSTFSFPCLPSSHPGAPLPAPHFPTPDLSISRDSPSFPHELSAPNSYPPPLNGPIILLLVPKPSPQVPPSLPKLSQYPGRVPHSSTAPDSRRASGPLPAPGPGRSHARREFPGRHRPAPPSSPSPAVAQRPSLRWQNIGLRATGPARPWRPGASRAKTARRGGAGTASPRPSPQRLARRRDPETEGHHTEVEIQGLLRPHSDRETLRHSWGPKPQGAVWDAVINGEHATKQARRSPEINTDIVRLNTDNSKPEGTPLKAGQSTSGHRGLCTSVTGMSPF